jgi:hypothetical protein
MEEAEDIHQEEGTVHAWRLAHWDEITAQPEKDLEEDEGEPLPGGEGEDVMEKWKAEVRESQFKACTTMPYKQAETWAAKYSPGDAFAYMPKPV